MASFTGKQAAFINHYIITLNGTEAARRAGYCGDDNSLGVTAHENLRKPKIKEEIDSRLSKLTMSAEETLARISKHASGSMEDFITWDDEFGYRLDIAKAAEAGKLDTIKKLKEIVNTRTDKDGNEFVTVRKEIELYPADNALDKLMRYHSLYNDKTDITSGGEKLGMGVEEWKAIHKAQTKATGETLDIFEGE